MTTTLAQAGQVSLTQHTDYPFDGAIHLVVRSEHLANFRLSLRIPGWADQAAIQINGVAMTEDLVPDTYVELMRAWQPGDEITLNFPMRPAVHRKLNRNVQESFAPDGSPVAQEVLRYEYLAISRGPLAYATGLIDGFKMEETLRLPPGRSDDWLQLLPAPTDGEGP
jgi:DUF1680 family protein